MQLSEFVRMLESYAPPELAESYDNIGLLIGTNREIRKVLVALDCTTTVAREAVSLGVDLVLTHHPLFFHPVQHILPDDPDTAAAFILLQNNIGMYAAHTNLDAADGGVNNALADALGLCRIRPIPDTAIGRLGELPEVMSLRSFTKLCESRLSTRVRVCGDPDKTVCTVGVIGGAGAEFAEQLSPYCDVFVTGEMKHHEAIRMNELGIACVVAGHYETESVIRKYWISRLQKQKNDVQYYETSLERAPLTAQEEE
ncbi:MAG: Nif3-like dinuclear metal center hexameric protein [Clostridia bacterium]|nr:Nif3-like dinuclear metal center hexameric protein [Clostridia bacterium]